MSTIGVAAIEMSGRKGLLVHPSDFNLDERVPATAVDRVVSRAMMSHIFRELHEPLEQRSMLVSRNPSGRSEIMQLLHNRERPHAMACLRQAVWKK
jgi:hypothetical protein